MRGTLPLLFALGLAIAPAAFAVSGPYVVTGPHSERVRRALGILESSLASEHGSSCRNYFAERGWRAPGAVSSEFPLVLITDVSIPGPAGWYALVPGQSPWTVIYLNPAVLAEQARIFLGDCALASLILHEMGHLARQDTSDNEPLDFFETCRVRCLDPGAWK